MSDIFVGRPEGSQSSGSSAEVRELRETASVRGDPVLCGTGSPYTALVTRLGYEISGTEYHRLLCNGMQSGRRPSTFRRNVLPPFSGCMR
jgi:hypothetical protein